MFYSCWSVAMCLRSCDQFKCQVLCTLAQIQLLCMQVYRSPIIGMFLNDIVYVVNNNNLLALRTIRSLLFLEN